MTDPAMTDPAMTDPAMSIGWRRGSRAGWTSGDLTLCWFYGVAMSSGQIAVRPVPLPTVTCCIPS